MSNKQIYAKQLSAEHIGTIANFDDVDGDAQRGEIRQISHDSLATFVFLLDPEYDKNQNFAFPEFELGHNTLIALEKDNE